MPNQPLLGVIFDFDGTVSHTLPICVEAFRRAAAPLAGRIYTDEEVMATFGPSEEGSVGRLAPGFEDECLEAYLRHYEELHQECLEPFPGVLDLLNELGAAGVRRGLVTGKGARSCEISLRVQGLAGLFDPVATGCAEGPCKPANIRQVLTAWDLPADRVAYVGDSPQDIVDAYETGLVPLAAAWAETADRDRLAAESPEALFTSVSDLGGWLLARISAA